MPTIRVLCRRIWRFTTQTLCRSSGQPTPKTSRGDHSASLIVLLTLMRDTLDGIPIPGIQGAISGLLEVIRTLRYMDENAEQFALLLEQVQLIHREVVRPISDPTTSTNIPLSLRTDIEDLSRSLEVITRTCFDLTQRNSIQRFFGYEDDIAVLQTLTREMDNALRWLTTRGVISLRMEAEAVRRRTIIDLLGRLPRAQAQYDAGVRIQASGCLEGTRTALLQVIQDWITDEEAHAPNIFWLCGLAGTGKSTVAQTVAEGLHKNGRLGASFFFSRDEADRRNPLLLFSSIAYQLSLFHPAFQTGIARSVEANPDVGRAVIRTQLQKLIIEPLHNIPIDEAPRLPIMVVIDALDECNDMARIIDSLIILASELHSFSFRLKFFITSRAEPQISSRFTSPPIGPVTKSFLLHDIEKSIVKGDIHLFLRHHLTQLALRYSIPLPWPSKEALATLVDRAGDLFIFAVTALNFIAHPHQSDPRAQLEFLLAEEWSEDGRPYRAMNNLYLRILQESIPREDSDAFVIRYQSVMGTIVVLQDPLSVDTLGSLLELRSDSVRGALARLHAVVLLPARSDQVIRLIHPSFREFLTSRRRCPDERFFANEELHHTLLAQRCIIHMQEVLKRDICEIKDPSKFNSEVPNLQARLRRFMPEHVKYACLYWASHLSKASPADFDFQECLTSFCRTKLLQWMEVLSLLGDLPSAVHSLKLVEQYISANASLRHLLSLIQDCHRFLLKYYEPISLSSAHIYYSALPFIPKSTLLETYGHEVGTSVKVVAGRKPSWSLCTRTLEMGVGLVQSVAISPDGQKFVSGHVNAVVRIWDVATGVVTAELRGHQRAITSVAYSPDGSTIASGSDDNSVRLWDPYTGNVKAIWRKNSDHRVMCVAFSSDGRYAAFGSSDTLVRVWDLVEDPEAQKVLELKGHLGRITSLAFSPQSNHLASSSNDHTVRIWVLTSRVSETQDDDRGRNRDVTLLGHYFSINSVKYSSDGTRVVTGSDDRSIRIWDSRTGNQVQVIYCQTKIAAISVVDDGDHHYVVSGCEDSTIRVWDASTGELRATLEGHFGRAESIDLSVANNLLVSSSSDFTIRLWNWNASLKYARAIVPPKASTIVGVGFSPNGEWIGVASVDGKVQLYRKDGVVVTTLDSDAHSWDSGAGSLFSPDSSRILTRRLDDMLLHLWNTSDGALIARLNARGLSFSLERVIFSPNSALLAAWSDSSDILLWETINGAPVVILQGHQAPIRSVSFAPNSALLVSGSDDGRIMVWDTVKHNRVAELWGHRSPVSEVGFSPDGRVISSRSELPRFIQWDAVSFRRIGGNPSFPAPYWSQTERGHRLNRSQWAGKWTIELEKDWMVLKSRPNNNGVQTKRRLCWVPNTFRGRPLSLNRANIRWDSHGSVAVCGIHTRRLAILDFSAMLEMMEPH